MRLRDNDPSWRFTLSQPTRTGIDRVISTESTGWGCARIAGELRKLRIHAVSEPTAKNILEAHFDSLYRVDFFSKTIGTPISLQQACVMAFPRVGTRRVFCSPC